MKKSAKREEVRFLVNLAKIQIVVSVMVAVYLLFIAFDRLNEAIATLLVALVLVAYYALKIRNYTQRFT